ncbi:hypothetical protein K458DRAFT_1554 [Lentithecium fluviatile CBS 122367]|uniref:Tim44-like domain-containing protein n=1 Tax=Lentithecium fluviatile CBS 122367 TaxID=1168545 RepID=A0A6G1JLR1_9PLEO|nr:hypothetical protein K458DRAFT_1554 [Lentithecium fluviatile CBS 122367]
MSTHLPIRTLRPFYQGCMFRRPDARPFSTTPSQLRGSRASERRRLVDSVQVRAAARYQNGGRSTSTQNQEQLDDESNLPDDIGILPGTFIHKPLLSQWTSPLRRSEPSEDDPWYKKNKVFARLNYEGHFLVSIVKQWIMLTRFRFDLGLLRCPPLYWNPLNRGLVKNIARERYAHLYQSFAEGDSKAISEMCLSSVAKKFNDRITARPRGLKAEWSHNADSIKTSMISNRATMLSFPGYDTTGVHQIVLRMQSNQSLAYNNAASTQGQDALTYISKEGTVVEYLVLQRLMIRGVFKEWKVWGFAREWDLETITEDATTERELNAYQSTQS